MPSMGGLHTDHSPQSARPSAGMLGAAAPSTSAMRKGEGEKSRQTTAQGDGTFPRGDSQVVAGSSTLSVQDIRAWLTFLNALDDNGRSKQAAIEAFQKAVRGRRPDLSKTQTEAFLKGIVNASAESRKGIAEPAKSNAQPDSEDTSRDRATTAPPDRAIAISDWCRLLESKRDPEAVELALTHSLIADGSGQPPERAEMLLDSEASHHLISKEACQRLRLETHELPPGMCQKVDHLKTSVPVDRAVWISWQFHGRAEAYSQQFYVVDGLPFDTIIGFSTINKFKLLRPGAVKFHRISENGTIKLNSYVLKKLGKGTTSFSKPAGSE